MQGGKTPRHKTQLRRHKFLNDFLKGRYIPMKKLISLFLALMMAILAIPALAEDAQDPDTAVDPNIDPDFLVGAWESWTGNPLEIPDDVKYIFDRATDELIGEPYNYEAIAILGTQVVAGTNYCFLCRKISYETGETIGYTLVYVFYSLNDDVELLNEQDIVFAPDATSPKVAESTDANGEILPGAWVSWAADPLDIPENVKAAFDKALEGLVGHTYEPIAILGTQVVSGMNYCLLCKTTVVTPDAPVSYTLVYIYEALDGTAEIMRIQDIVFDAFPAENG